MFRNDHFFMETKLLILIYFKLSILVITIIIEYSESIEGFIGKN